MNECENEIFFLIIYLIGNKEKVRFFFYCNTHTHIASGKKTRTRNIMSIYFKRRKIEKNNQDPLEKEKRRRNI